MSVLNYQRISELLRDVLPPVFLRKISGLFYGWRGNYSSWVEADKKCSGYDSNNILEKVIKTSLMVKEGIIPYERDSVPFDKIEYSFPLLAGLMWIAGRNGGKLNVLDFGGSLGSSYFQNKLFLDSLIECNWCIVEQSHFVKVGNANFTDNNLRFFYSINDCLNSFDIDVILFSGVLGYLEKPFEILENVISKNLAYIIINNTRFIEKENDRLTIHKVAPWIYKAKYCAWFFNESTFLSNFKKKYDLIYDFEIPENINIRSKCKGFLFKNKTTNQ
jgi:putative methyltransferase (TIGR04325 family)